MIEVKVDQALFSQSAGKTVLITGAARGIGAATAILFNSHGANVILADLPQLRDSAEEVIQKQMEFPNRAIFVSTNIINWAELTACFETAITTFGKLDIVIANAGIMESEAVLDMDNVDANGRLLESLEAGRHASSLKIALRLGLHYTNCSTSTTTSPQPTKSILLVASTSSYFGGTGVAAYVASKHGVLGLLRACQNVARVHGVRVNAVAPFLTPTHITAGFARKWDEAGLEKNTPDRVADAIAFMALDDKREGECVLVAGKYLRELEGPRAKLLPSWLGVDLMEFMGQAMQFFVSIGGYVLPKKY
ncbi:uncharacterized protein N7518_000752 [Penicillium psychrosexuale]|uniref:uncharacterized protein n=1 Tax=Penicillium psychrosexuale TaxID=1002107 RepID=UPI002544D3CA|nr:uncharacterized protein N7518_000752 [Penicillium psychrosexuale]KAJ5804449.1 hypothetical protein N7518_000752 [Penicillium psychrosexuale]